MLLIDNVFWFYAGTINLFLGLINLRMALECSISEESFKFGIFQALAITLGGMLLCMAGLTK